jgi:hypothetical protein
MAFDLFIDPPTIDLPMVKAMQIFRWGHLPERVAYFVAVEEQYLRFHLLLLERARFTGAGKLSEKPWVKPLGLTVRSGAIKAAVLLTASISEAVLRAIAEAREYDLPKNEHHRTMGKVLGAWQQENGTPREEIAGIWPILQDLHSIRNNVHLFKAADDPSATFQAILNREESLVPNLLSTIDALAAIKP